MHVEQKSLYHVINVHYRHFLTMSLNVLSGYLGLTVRHSEIFAIHLRDILNIDRSNCYEVWQVIGNCKCIIFMTIESPRNDCQCDGNGTL